MRNLRRTLERYPSLQMGYKTGLIPSFCLDVVVDIRSPESLQLFGAHEENQPSEQVRVWRMTEHKETGSLALDDIIVL